MSIQKNIYKLNLTIIDPKPSNLIYFLKKIKNSYFKKYNMIIISEPKKIQLYTLLRSPHVNKKSREQFKFLFYKYVFIISLSERAFLKLILFLKQLPIQFPLQICIEKELKLKIDIK